MPNALKMSTKIPCKCKCKFTIKNTAYLKFDHGRTRVGGTALCKLLTTYLVCRTFYNPNDPLQYLHTRAYGGRLRVRVAVKFDPRGIPRTQEGGNFMIAAHPIT